MRGGRMARRAEGCFSIWERTWWTRHWCSLVFPIRCGQAFGWSGRARRSDDAFDLYLHYPAPPAQVSSSPSGPAPSGLGVWLRATCLARDPEARFTLNGTQGTFRKFGNDPQEAHLLAGDMFSSKPWGVESPEHWGTLITDEDGDPVSTRVPTEPGDYRGYYINLRDALHGNAALEVTPLQAWRTMRTLEMAVESSRTGCTITCDWTHEP